MRTWSVFLFLLATSLAGCFDDLPETPSEIDSDAPAPQGGLGPGNGTLYLHAAGDDLWMDTDAGATDGALTGTVAPAAEAPTHRFVLRPAPAREVVLDGAEVRLDVLLENVVGAAPDYQVALVVDGTEVDRQTSTSASIPLDAAGTWPAGASVELRVCVCPAPASIAYNYELRTEGGSQVTLSFPDAGQGTAGGGATGSGSQSGGDVTVSRQGDRWVATKILTFDDASADRATVDLGTVNGAVTVTRGGSNAHLEATLKAHGDTEQEARDRLQGMDVDQSAATAAGVLDYSAHGTVSGNQWNNRSIGLHLRLPSILDALDVQITNGAVTVDDFQGGDWDLSTVNGAVDVEGATVRSLDAGTSNGRVTLDATVDDLDASASNGQIVADLRAAASGSWDLSTTNGAIELTVPEDADRGYDATASTTNGAITFDFQETEEVGQQSSKDRHERTTGYDGRAIQTTVDLDTVNGNIGAGS